MGIAPQKIAGDRPNGRTVHILPFSAHPKEYVNGCCQGSPWFYFTIAESEIRSTARHILQLAAHTPTVFLPTHEWYARRRLDAQERIVLRDQD